MPSTRSKNQNTSTPTTDLSPLPADIRDQYPGLKAITEKTTFIDDFRLPKTAVERDIKAGHLHTVLIGPNIYITAPDAIRYFEYLRQNAVAANDELVEKRKQRTAKATLAAAAKRKANRG